MLKNIRKIIFNTTGTGTVRYSTVPCGNVAERDLRDFEVTYYRKNSKSEIWEICAKNDGDGNSKIYVGNIISFPLS